MAEPGFDCVQILEDNRPWLGIEPEFGKINLNCLSAHPCLPTADIKNSILNRTLDGRQGQHGDKPEWTTINAPYLNHRSNYSILQFLQPAIVTPASYSPPGRNSSFPVLGYESLISELQASDHGPSCHHTVTPRTVWVAPVLPPDPSSPSDTAPCCSRCQLLQRIPCSRIHSR